MGMPWHETSWACPICGAKTHACSDSDEGRVYESEDECRACRLWSAEFAYGGHAERIGAAWFSWSYSDEDDFEDDRRAARAELKRAFAHPDYAAMRDAPPWARADWLEDHDFPVQAAAVRLEAA